MSMKLKNNYWKDQFPSVNPFGAQAGPAYALKRRVYHVHVYVSYWDEKRQNFRPPNNERF